MSIWNVELKLYNYQKNPIWNFDIDNVRRLFKAIAKIEKFGQTTKSFSFDGYCIHLYFNNKLVIMYCNRQILYMRMNIIENLEDINQEVESILISSAPEKYKKDIKYYINITNNEFEH